MRVARSIPHLPSCPILATPTLGLWFRSVAIFIKESLLYFLEKLSIVFSSNFPFSFVFPQTNLCKIRMKNNCLHHCQEDGTMEVYAQREIKKGDEVVCSWFLKAFHGWEQWMQIVHDEINENHNMMQKFVQFVKTYVLYEANYWRWIHQEV